jgi:glycerol kinase
MAIDQGTTSTRAIIFNDEGLPLASDQIEHEQIFPQAGWVEHDPMEIWRNTREVMGAAMAKSNLFVSDLLAVGITQQRETTVVWNKTSGMPVYNAIVWQDTRTQDICDGLARTVGEPRFREVTGLPLATYFSGPKVRWILDNVPGARAQAEAGELLMGTIDTWLLWNLTNGQVHATDPTNASRTLLMDLDTLEWSEELAEAIGIPMTMLPEIRSSSEVYGHVQSPASMRGVPIAGILGDQQAATFGQACLSPGEAKNTYGTGNFLLLNTGTQKVLSENGLLTTVCYKIGDAPAVYALEGSIAMTGSLIQWLRDNLGMVEKASDIEPLASSRPIGAGMRAGSSSVSPDSSTRDTSPERRWRPLPSSRVR